MGRRPPLDPDEQDRLDALRRHEEHVQRLAAPITREELMNALNEAARVHPNARDVLATVLKEIE